MAALAAACLVAAAACASPLFEPARDGPLVYLVLGQTVAADGGSVQRAFLLESDSVLPRYRSAERFEVERISDGATFGWRDRDLRGGSPLRPSQTAVPVEKGNFQLVLPPGAGGPADVLRPGEYRLHIETGGVTVTGTATLPAPFALTLRDSAGRRVLAWPRVRGAASYQVEADSLAVDARAAAGDLFSALHRDTAVVLPRALPPGTVLRVDALDANVTRALEGGRLDRAAAGLEGAVGLFGGLSEASITLPG